MSEKGALWVSSPGW